MNTAMPKEQVAQRVRSAGLRPTRQRVALAELLFAKGDRHLAAEELHEEATAAGVPVSLATGYAWWIFALLILAPDLSMIGYLAGPHAGAIAYNVVHTLIAPLALAAMGLWFGLDWALQIAIILMAHIAIDRALGYGLKLSTGFKDTHLGRIGGA